MKTAMIDKIVKFGVLSAIIAVAVPEMSFAEDTLGAAINNIRTEEMQAVPDTVAAVAYIIGAVLVVSGALSLKKHAESPAQENMGKGIGRLAAGGAIIGLPALTDFIRNSAHVGGDNVAFTPFDATF
ncbi:MAG: hypothetical protein EOM37_08125 [Proteobacteria bacterium]|jgi:hypothetical protein|nr:hypothetical protein [Alphaproteobacteria bacterium]NCC03993.1 hypothetical protein [Pseudomonadota bacterium]